MTTSDSVNHPRHYNVGKIEVIDFIEDQGLAYDFCIGNIIKYVVRAKHKNHQLEDLKKAHWYLSKAIEVVEKENAPKPENTLCK